MKSKKTVLVTLLVLVLTLFLISVSFMAGIRYARMQALDAQSEFFRERGGQPGAQGSNPSHLSGIASNPVMQPVMQMLHDMVGVPMLGQ